jgi:hypothetical protein
MGRISQQIYLSPTTSLQLQKIQRASVSDSSSDTHLRGAWGGAPHACAAFADLYQHYICAWGPGVFGGDVVEGRAQGVSVHLVAGDAVLVLNLVVLANAVLPGSHKASADKNKIDFMCWFSWKGSRGRRNS